MTIRLQHYQKLFVVICTHSHCGNKVYAKVCIQLNCNAPHMRLVFCTNRKTPRGISSDIFREVFEFIACLKESACFYGLYIPDISLRLWRLKVREIGRIGRIGDGWDKDVEGVEGGRRLDRWRFEEAVGAGKSKWLLGRLYGREVQTFKHTA